MTVLIIFILAFVVVILISANKAHSQQKEYIENSGGILIKYDPFVNELYRFGMHSKIYPVNKTTFVVHYWGGSMDKKAILHVQYVFGKTVVAWFFPLSNGGTDKTIREFDEGENQTLMAKWAISEYGNFMKRLQLTD